jgi:hypothetical protein
VISANGLKHNNCVGCIVGFLQLQTLSLFADPIPLCLLLVQTDLYKEDWIGLKALDAGGRVTYIKLPGRHLAMSEDEILKSIVPYLLPSLPSRPRVIVL